MTLADLLGAISPLDVHGSSDVPVDHVTRDSREAGATSVFVAVVGATVDGHRFASDLDCAAVVVERDVPVRDGVTAIRVSDSKLALAQLAAALHGYPGRDVRVVGITGTNGKTTIATLVEGALLHLGERVARIGTTGNAIDGVLQPSRFTTPEAPQLQAFLAELRDSGVPTLVMEVSSIGLAQRRVDGIGFAVAAFTNLTQDHLDFHGDMESYAAAKARLFTELLEGRAILCSDDPAWTRMRAGDDAWTYGSSVDADLRIVASAFDARGIALRLETPEGPARIDSPMIGRHNAQNLTAALGILLALGRGLEESCAALGAVRGVPGRLEVVPDPAGRLVVVDYAHTPDALSHALRCVREVTEGQLWVVFGCGGDRDRAKRPQMGHIARTLADRVVVTSDNPRSEPPGDIVTEIVAGIGDMSPVHVDVDRSAAIRWAVEHSGPGDTVLIAGKGHETYQEIDGERLPFDDRLVARDALI